MARRRVRHSHIKLGNLWDGRALKVCQPSVRIFKGRLYVDVENAPQEKEVDKITCDLVITVFDDNPEEATGKIQFRSTFVRTLSLKNGLTRIVATIEDKTIERIFKSVESA